MVGLSAMFTGRQLQSAFNQFQAQVDNKIIESLQYVGEEFVNKARDIKTYKNRTGNLQASIGYIVLAHGKIVQEDFEGEPEGVEKGKSIASEVAANYPYGYVLIGVAGMDYAAAVESRGYDVITGSAPTKAILQDLLNSIK